MSLLGTLYTRLWLAYDELEFTQGGLLLYITAFMMLVLPLVVFAFEHFLGDGSSPGSPSIPIPPPTTVMEIRIYPIKSCRGFTVSTVKLLKTGLDLDRSWMFVDAADLKFLTIRQISAMTLIDTRVDGNDELEVSIRTKPGVGFKIPAHPSQKWLEENTELAPECEIWGKKVDGYVYKKEMTAAFSEFFKKDVRLVYKGPTPRILGGNGAPALLGRIESTKFADVLPLQISNQKSMDELNFRLKSVGEKPITIERFRPNIIVEGDEAWYEDVWKTVKIHTGEKKSVTIDVSARCARCQVPNVDPDTAIKHKKQPWNMLMSYRRVDEGIKFKPCFGMLCAPREEGVVAVGMRFEVTEVTSKHKYAKGMS
jgi:uncharacterized protein YcbX